MTAPNHIDYNAGFYALESDGVVNFRWVQLRAWLQFAAANHDRYLEFQVLSQFTDLSQELSGTAGSTSARFPLREGWAPVSFTIPAGATELALGVNKIFPRAYYAAGDGRDLAVRVRDAVMHHNARRHANVTTQHANFVANCHEMFAGVTTLASTPPRVGIDLYGACNIKPPCVYCDWDTGKSAEGADVDTPFTRETLQEWGPFFDNSRTLINCSIGEPFMMRNIDELLDAFGEGDKSLELTTNGQIMTDRIIQRLVGRRIKLHISLDAGTPETYAKLRNNRFDAIIRNLERLIEAKGGPGPYPHIHLVFMPMRLNVDELPAFIELAARLRVDEAVLRPLNYAFESNLNWDRAGYRFEYVKELLPFEELARVSGRAAELAERAGVHLADQMGFGGLMHVQFAELFDEGRRSVDPPRAPAPAIPPTTTVEAAPIEPSPIEPAPSLGAATKPLCTEPWDSLYILRRGVLPCCYGAKPIAKMTEYREAWNSPLLQEIRRDLAAGQFHQYCRESPSCPIVRKAFGDAPPPPVSEPPAPTPPPGWRLRARAATAWRRLSGR